VPAAVDLGDGIVQDAVKPGQELLFILQIRRGPERLEQVVLQRISCWRRIGNLSSPVSQRLLVMVD
jgi:hypothetical protein